MKILLVEDEAELVRTLTQSLGTLGIQVEGRGDGASADAALQQHAYDVVVLDLALPRLPGLEVLRRLRQRNDTVPVLVLTASGVLGLELGADDYLAKPFELSELEARLRALYRRRLNTAHSVLAVGALGFDTVSRRFTVGGQPLELPPREHDLLEALMINAGRPVNKLLLADRLRSSDSVLSHDALEVYVHRLRRRIEGSGAAIHTLRGLGYLLEAADASPA